MMTDRDIERAAAWLLGYAAGVRYGAPLHLSECTTEQVTARWINDHGLDGVSDANKRELVRRVQVLLGQKRDDATARSSR